MKFINRNMKWQALFVAVLFSSIASAQDVKTIGSSPLSLQVYTAAEDSFGVTSVLVSGKEKAILFDAQFTKENAERLAETVVKSGKTLQAIVITHGDPDYYFGLQVLKKYFPDVPVYTMPATYQHILATAQDKLDFWGPKLGSSLSPNVVLPQVYRGTSFELEGHQLQIEGLHDFPNQTFIWIPEIKAVIGGINVIGDTFHVWTADAATVAAKEKWLNVLAYIKALQPTIVIPAHGNAESSRDLRSVDYTAQYLKDYMDAVNQAKDSKALIQLMEKKYPNAKFKTALELGAPVNKGEVKW